MLLLSTVLKIVALASYLTLVLLTLRSGAERSARYFFSIYLFGILSWQFCSVMVNLTRSPATALIWYNLLLAGSGSWTILFFPFTRAFVRIATQKVLAACAYASCAAILVAGVFGRPFREVIMGKAGYWVPVYNSPLLPVVAGISYLFWGVGVFNLVRGLVRERSPVQRNRIVYVLLGATIVVLGGTSDLTPLRDYPIDIACNLASALIIGYAVVRYRLLDIRVILARSLFYSILTASLVLVYLGIVLGLETLLKQRVGYRGSISGLIALATIAIVLLPLRNVMQRLLDRLFFRESADYQRIIQSFSRSVTVLYDADQILSLIATTVRDALRTDRASVTLLDESTRSYTLVMLAGAPIADPATLTISERAPIVRWLRREGLPLVREEALIDPRLQGLVEENGALFTDARTGAVVPILLGDRMLGMLNLGDKRSGTMFRGDDLRFLTTLANQAATAIERSMVYQQIQRRLSEQTLLFILSEKFRGDVGLEAAMLSIVDVLKSFLSCDYCALVSFERDGGSKSYATDPVSEAAASIASDFGIEAIARIGSGGGAPSAALLGMLDGTERSSRLSDDERQALSTLQCHPLASGGEPFGVLILPNRARARLFEPPESEILRTICAILSQGIALHRTIVNLTSVKTYNESILNSLSDMGDTLVILDLTGVIRRVNPATCRRLGYDEQELVGRPVSVIASEGEPLFSPEGIARLVASRSVTSYQIAYRTRNGEPVPMLFSGSVIAGEYGRAPEIVGIARDLSERLKAEEAAKNLLLLQEIHHRIKNNLQVISSLLYLQSAYVHDEATREMFMESQNRVRSMALLHEKLYRSPNPSGVDFSEYIRDLTANLRGLYGARTFVEILVEISDVTLGVDTAVPCGLIINELVTNALKHAFPDGSSGTVTIGLRPVARGAGEAAEGLYELRVADSGSGFPDGLDFRTTSSLGLKIVGTLTRQLGGKIEMERNGGTCFTILFRER